MAESFGANAERYDRTRPRYPDALVARIVDASPGPQVLDVGVGTGIVSRQFQAAGCQVLGVDPDARMAAFARGQGVEVEVATFESWDPAGRAFDAVVAGQTWHWVDPAAGAAKAAQVLRRGGRLAVFWNCAQPPSSLIEQFAWVYREVLPESIAGRGWARPAADAYGTMCARAADGMREAGRFGEPERWQFEWERTYSRDAWLDQVPTTADHSQFPVAQIDSLLTGLGAVIDAAGGDVAVHYTTDVATAARTA